MLTVALKEPHVRILEGPPLDPLKGGRFPKLNANLYQLLGEFSPSLFWPKVLFLGTTPKIWGDEKTRTTKATLQDEVHLPRVRSQCLGQA
jgi:hypothetical protein